MKTDKPRIQIRLQPAYLICVVVLATAACGMSVAIKSLGVYLKKDPLPLRKSFDVLDANGLGPYEVLAKYKIQNHDVLESLGTDEYIQWVVEDTEVPASSSVRRFLLFLTYYDQPDRVPHVPEECHLGAGFQPLGADRLTLNIQADGFARKVPAKLLVFGKTKQDMWGSGYQFPVLYFFRVNDSYEGNRDDARMALNKSMFRKVSYFSKVELAFSQGPIAPTSKEAIEASKKLLRVVLPLLEREHWPDTTQPSSAGP